jgi:L-threonylcarbamoyladenylate synthase
MQGASGGGPGAGGPVGPGAGEPDVALAAAAAVLRRSGVVAYPTEAVFGLGCDPRDRAAFEKLFALKERPPTQGVLLIGADFAQVAPYIDLAAVPAAALARAQATWPGPHTWIFPRAAGVPAWIAGGHAGIALRVTAHPLAAALCRAFGGALVSTSANRHGEAPARSAAAVRALFGGTLDALVDGAVGGLERPTPIRDAISGDVLRT